MCFSYLGLHKGIDCLVAALRILLADSTLTGRWAISIAGQGDQQAKVTDLVAEIISRNHVHYCGKLDHAAALSLLDRSDVQILSSIWPENEPVSILESIERGKTQIASDIGGIPELIEHDNSGLLFEPGNAVMPAKSMRLLICEPERISRYCDYNEKRRNQFNETSSISKLIDLYKNTVDNFETEAPTKKFVIACSGSSPTIEVDIILANLHKIDHGKFPTFIVWSEWVDNHMWSDVDALWVWSDEDAQWNVVMKALRLGLPIVSTIGSRFESATRVVDHEITYSTWQNAIEILASLPIIAEELKSRAVQRKGLAKLISPLLNDQHSNLYVKG